MVFTPFDHEEFDKLVGEAYDAVMAKCPYEGDVRRDIQCLVYLVNRKYMSQDDANIIMNSIVFGDDAVNGEFDNIPPANNVISKMAVHNQKAIREDGANINNLIDPSVFCYGEEDKKLVRNMFEHYFEAYQDSRKYVCNRDEFLFSFLGETDKPYTILFRQLTNSALSTSGNICDLSVGARWLAIKTLGGGIMQLLRDYQGDKFTFDELKEYYIGSELQKQQWLLREDSKLDPLCPQTELEVLVTQFGELWAVVYDNTYNDLYTTLSIECGHSNSK
jgi:hypothetical protein